jgi:hypothetical protein
MSRKVHRADLINSHGSISALCFKKPHPINMMKESWTNRDEAVTCKACLKLINAQKQVADGA